LGDREMAAELKCSDGTVVKISSETEEELRRQFGPKKIVFGDIVFLKNDKDKRVILYDSVGTLRAYSIRDKKPRSQSSGLWLYIPTGKNIFKDNLLNLTVY